jgi:NTE family protein
MDETSSTSSAQRGSRVLPFERVVLVMQGGGALGSYQAGVFAALAEANNEGNVRLDWVCGVSIGAINAALIGGNPREKRVQRLREFWDAVTEPPNMLPGLAWLARLPWASGDPMRLWTDSMSAAASKPYGAPNSLPSFLDFLGGKGDSGRAFAIKMSAAATMLYGTPNFYLPRPHPPVSSEAERPDAVSFYDTSPLKSTLERLVDFDLINSKQMRLSVGATNARTGASVYFDNFEQKITAAHIMASGALPPGFPPVEIDGEYYWDGGVVSNSPLQFVADSRPLYSSLVLQVDLWDADGEMPLDITTANLRATEVHSASRLNVSLEQFRSMQQLRRDLSQLLEELPKERRNEPQIQRLSEAARVQIATVVRLKYQAKKYEAANKMFDFSRATMEERWAAGYDDAQVAINEPAIRELPDLANPVRIFDAHHGWII